MRCAAMAFASKSPMSTSGQNRSVTTSEVEFHFREFGLPTGRPVFLLHGFPDDPSTWNEVVNRLKQDKLGVRFIAPFQRGYGPTMVRQEDLLGGEVAALAQDVLSLADALGFGKFAIIGHDWGARAG